jgi:hypothetical protein
MGFENPTPSPPGRAFFRRHHGLGKELDTEERGIRSSMASRNPPICNTYGTPRMCCKQRTCGNTKSFRCHTYKKQGGVGVLLLTRNPNMDSYPEGVARPKRFPARTSKARKEPCAIIALAIHPFARKATQE